MSKKMAEGQLGGCIGRQSKDLKIKQRIREAAITRRFTYCSKFVKLLLHSVFS